MMDEIIKKISSLGLPGIILVITVAASTGAGSYPIVTAIAILGGPFGVLGGLTVLGLMTIVGEALAKYGIEAVLGAIYKERSKNESIKALLKEISDLPVSDALKINLNHVLESTESTN